VRVRQPPTHSLSVLQNTMGDEEGLDASSGGDAGTTKGGGGTHPLVQKLLERARHAMDTLEPDLAVKFYEKALAQEEAKEDVSVIDEAAEVMLQTGCVERATELLRRSMELAPHSGSGKYLSMAQLHEGKEALALLMKGVDLIGSSEEDRRDLCLAWCAVGELWMTDLCDEPEAENECEKALSNALGAGYEGPEAHHSIASMKLSQNRPDEALKSALEAAKRLKSCDPLPDYGARVSFSKVLLECGLAEEASEVLHDLIDEADEDVETWFLLGCAYFQMDPPDLDIAKQHLERAHGMLEKVREALGDDFTYEQQEKLVRDQLALVDAARACPPPVDESDMDTGDAD
jgi:tetratricopeptide (TPR) repeat protein